MEQVKTKKSQAMEDLSALQDQIDALAAQVTKQGSVVRQLKKDGAASEDIAEAVTLLKKLKVDAEALKAKQDELDPSKKFNRKTFDELILRKMFVVPSFEIHGGVKGLFDLGPPACALKVCFVLVLSWRAYYFQCHVSVRPSLNYILYHGYLTTCQKQRDHFSQQCIAYV